MDNSNITYNSSIDVARRTSCGSLLIDFSVINDCDVIIDDCKKFLILTTDSTYNLFPLMTRFSSNMKSWQTKRRDVKLMNVYDELYPRVLTGNILHLLYNYHHYRHYYNYHKPPSSKESPLCVRSLMTHCKSATRSDSKHLA